MWFCKGKVSEAKFFEKNRKISKAFVNKVLALFAYDDVRLRKIQHENGGTNENCSNF
jgi:hypothetical protein